MKKITIYIVLAVLCLNFTAHAQDKTNITVLKIGDTVPDITINNIIGYKGSDGKATTTTKISDFKGKLLIINFWSTGCGTCITALPKVDALQRQYKDQVQILSVSYENEQRVKKFLLANANGKMFRGIILTDDTLLKKIFPHQFLPHIVLIKNGVYFKSWPEEYLTAGNIKGVLSGKELGLGQKADVLNFNYSKPIFDWKAGERLNNNKPLYSTVFSGFIDGLPTKAGFSNDSIHHISRYYIINHSALHLYALALRSGLPLTPNRSLLEVKNQGAFIHRKGNGYLTDWQKNNCFTYERTYPSGTDKSQVAAQLKNDLDFYLNTYGRIEEREVACLELHINSHNKLISVYPDQNIAKDTSGTYPYLHHIHVDDLVYILNQLEDSPPIINETGMLQSFDLDFRTGPKSIQDWQAELKSYGFELKRVQRRLPMFILSDKPPLSAHSQP
jgi:thiol-disulfide isomerase/thioredoxin